MSRIVSRGRRHGKVEGVTWIGGDELARLNAAEDVKVIPDLVQDSAAAAERHRVTSPRGRQGRLDVGGVVGYRVGRDDAGGREELHAEAGSGS